MANLKANKPLVAKTTLKAKSALKANKKPKKQTTVSITTLKRKADKLVSQYVRLRDSEIGEEGFYGTCITCSKHGLVAWHDGKKLRFTRGWDAGHYIGRGNWFLRHDEENVNLQCSMRCNNYRSGEHEKYRLALDFKYGDGTAKKLDMLAAVNPAHPIKKPELQQIIDDSKTQIDFYITQLKEQS